MRRSHWWIFPAALPLVQIRLTSIAESELLSLELLLILSLHPLPLLSPLPTFQSQRSVPNSVTLYPNSIKIQFIPLLLKVEGGGVHLLGLKDISKFSWTVIIRIGIEEASGVYLAGWRGAGEY